MGFVKRLLSCFLSTSAAFSAALPGLPTTIGFAIRNASRTISVGWPRGYSVAGEASFKKISSVSSTTAMPEVRNSPKILGTALLALRVVAIVAAWEKEGLEGELAEITTVSVLMVGRGVQ